MIRARKGFALAAVLWTLTVATVLAAAAALTGRSTYDASRNRTNAARAQWIAEGCAATLLAAADRVMHDANDLSRPTVWRTLDTVVDSVRAELLAGCAVTLRAAGGTLNVNGAEETMLRKYLRNAAGPSVADALADALFDWRDEDSIMRPAGAEADWYLANGRPAPRNGAFVSGEEVTLVRGFESRPDVTRYLSISAARICLSTAPAEVLIALPGFTDDAVRRVLDDRSAGRRFGELSELVARVPTAAAESLAIHFSELAAATTVEPQQWELAVQAASGQPAVRASVVLLLDQFGNRVTVLQRRTR